MSEIVNANSLADKLQVTPATGWPWARPGWIPSLRAGRWPVLFDVQEPEQTLREHAKPKESTDDQ